MKRASKLCSKNQNLSLSPSSIRKKKRVKEGSSLENNSLINLGNDIDLSSNKTIIIEANLSIKKTGISNTSSDSPKIKAISENNLNGLKSVSLSEEEEKIVADYIKSSHDRQMPVTDCQVGQVINEIICKRENSDILCDSSCHRLQVKFSSQNLLSSFKKNHPKAPFKTSKSAKTNKESVNEWFSDTYNYFLENDLLDVLETPSRNFAIGETAVPIEYSSLIDSAVKKSNNNIIGDHVSVLGSICADGEVPPPMIVYSAENSSATLMEHISDSVSVGYSENGYVTPSVLNKYFSNTFLPWIDKNNIKRPVIVWTDNFDSRKDFNLFEILKKEGILLYSLPNTAHVNHQLSTSIFGSIKIAWDQFLGSWALSTNKNIVYQILPKLFFLLYFNRCTTKSNKTIFQMAGLVPWNPQITNCSKYIESSLLKYTIEQMTRQRSILDLVKVQQKNEVGLKVDQSTQTFGSTSFDKKTKICKSKEAARKLQAKGSIDDSVIDMNCNRALLCEVNRTKAKMQFPKFQASHRQNTNKVEPPSLIETPVEPPSLIETPVSLSMNPLLTNKHIKIFKKKGLFKLKKLLSVKVKSNLKIKKIALRYLTSEDLKKELQKRKRDELIFKKLKQKNEIVKVQIKKFKERKILFAQTKRGNQFKEVDTKNFLCDKNFCVSNIKTSTDAINKDVHSNQKNESKQQSSPISVNCLQEKKFDSCILRNKDETQVNSESIKTDLDWEKINHNTKASIESIPSSSSSFSFNSTSPLDVICSLNDTLSIPRKLVRGQDMWLQDGGEEAAQILKCMKCHKSFKKFSDMISHMQQKHHHSRTVPNKSESKFTANLNSILTCKKCGLTFSSVRKMNIHIAKYGHHSKHPKLVNEISSMKLLSQEKLGYKCPSTYNSNASGQYNYVEQLDKALNAKIPCEKCGDKIATQIFIDHIRICRKIQDKNVFCNSFQIPEWRNLNLSTQSNCIDPLSEYYYKSIYNIDPLDYYYKAYYQSFKDIKRKKILENLKEVSSLTNTPNNYSQNNYEDHDKIFKNLLNPLHDVSSTDKDASSKSTSHLDSQEMSKVLISQDGNNCGSAEAGQEDILQSMLLKYYCLEIDKSSYSYDHLQPNMETFWYDHIMKQVPSSSHGTTGNNKNISISQKSKIKDELNITEPCGIKYEDEVKKEVGLDGHLSLPEISQSTSSNWKTNKERGCSSGTVENTPGGSFNPLAALQKLCDTAETQGNNALNTGCSELEKIQNSIKDFSWPCNENLKTNSVVRCAFCNTSFISLDTYRLHLTKMHFVKNMNIPTAKPFV